MTTFEEDMDNLFYMLYMDKAEKEYQAEQQRRYEPAQEDPEQEEETDN